MFPRMIRESGRSRSFGAISTCARLFGLAISTLLLSSVASAQTQSPVQEQNRKSYSRFLEMQRKPALAPGQHLGSRRLAAAAAVKNAPGKDATRDRLLKYQNERTPQPDARSFVADSPILEEVAAGDDREFAQVIFWNEAALRITALDHTPLPPGSSLDTHPIEQVGPARTARAMAIVHIAMFEAVNAVHRKYESYKGIQQKIFTITGLSPNIAPADVSVRHAIAYAAYRTLSEVYPGKREDLDITLTGNLTAIQAPANQANAGREIGEAAARGILDDRAFDGSELPDPPSSIFQSTLPTSDPLKWRQDPLNADPAVAIGANWRHVRPFVLEKAEQFRPPPPPAIGTPEYNEAFKLTLEKGGDPNAGLTDPPGNRDRHPFPTTRTPEETFIGIFWAYDAHGAALRPAPAVQHGRHVAGLEGEEVNVPRRPGTGQVPRAGQRGDR